MVSIADAKLRGPKVRAAVGTLYVLRGAYRLFVGTFGMF